MWSRKPKKTLDLNREYRYNEKDLKTIQNLEDIVWKTAKKHWI